MVYNLLFLTIHYYLYQKYKGYAKKWYYQTLVRGALALRVSGFNASTTVQQTIASTNIIGKINPSKLLRCNILPPKRCFNLRVETCQGWSAGTSEHIRV